MAAPTSNTDRPSDGPGVTRRQMGLLIVILLVLTLGFSVVSAQFFVPLGQPIPEATALPSE
jgi:hypothetical protein